MCQSLYPQRKVKGRRRRESRQRWISDARSWRTCVERVPIELETRGKVASRAYVQIRRTVTVFWHAGRRPDRRHPFTYSHRLGVLYRPWPASSYRRSFRRSRSRRSTSPRMSTSRRRRRPSSKRSSPSCRRRNSSTSRRAPATDQRDHSDHQVQAPAPVAAAAGAAHGTPHRAWIRSIRCKIGEDYYPGRLEARQRRRPLRREDDGRASDGRSPRRNHSAEFAVFRGWMTPV